MTKEEFEIALFLLGFKKQRGNRWIKEDCSVYSYKKDGIISIWNKSLMQTGLTRKRALDILSKIKYDS